jgi:hypothetical protein
MAVALVENDRDPVFVSPPWLHLHEQRADLLVAANAKELLLTDEGARSL